MSTAESSPELPAALMGYPPDAAEAYLRYQASKAPADLESFLLRALDFLLERGPDDSITQLPKETRLMEDLGADSLLVAELVFLLEDIFSIQLDNEDLAAVGDLADLQTLVKRKALS